MNSRRAWLVFLVGVGAYIIAIMQRTTIGVAGVAATDRFHSDAATLSSLAVLQLVVYAGMQIPVGVLIDRLGPRVLLVGGMSLMVIGQAVVAFAPSIGIAIVGRVLVGAGDATVFTSVMRLTASWFRGRLVPQLSQWIGNLGQLGQVLSAVPFAFLLHESGWTIAFTSAAACSVLALIALIIVIADRPADAPAGQSPQTFRHSLQLLRAALARPGTRLGFWSHYSTQSSGTIFSLMWGFPFMVYGLGYRPATAAHLLIVLVATGAVVGPVLGLLSARFPLRRSNIVLSVIFFMAVVWTTVLVWPGTPPFWLILLLLVAMGIGGPGSIIAFDYARTFNPSHSLGSANGIVNVGGFLASFVMIFLIGFILDVHNTVTGGGGPDQLYSLASFRLAFLVEYLVIGIGVVFLLRTRRQARRALTEEEGIQVGPLWVALVRRWRARRR